jgi:hypothetical protein
MTEILALQELETDEPGAELGFDGWSYRSGTAFR